MPSSRASTAAPSRFAISAAALTVLVGACSDPTVVPDPTATRVERAVTDPIAVADEPATLRLEGCAVDQYYIPRTGTPVRVTSVDGRLLGHATSGRQGEFSLRVVAQAQYLVGVERPDGETLHVHPVRGDVWMTSCLVDPDR